jgi:hypothetical protein
LLLAPTAALLFPLLTLLLGHGVGGGRQQRMRPVDHVIDESDTFEGSPHPLEVHPCPNPFVIHQPPIPLHARVL